MDEMSFGRVLRLIEHFRPGDHLCCLYETEEEHRAVLTTFLRQGLERGEKVLYIVDAHTAEAILGYLRDEGVDVEACLERGQFAILSRDEAYMREGVFDPEQMIALLRAETERALAEGYPALRVTGEMTWALRGLPGSERLIEYEAKLNEFFPGSQCLAICQYDRRRFDAALLLDVLRTHPIAVIGTEVYDNFYYIPPAEFLSGDRAMVELQHWEQGLAQRRQAEEQLRYLNAVLLAIRNVNQLITREKDRDRLLKGACESLIRTQGYLSAWIALLDESRGLVTAAEAGLGEDFLPLVKRLERGELPHCAQVALEQADVLVIEDLLSTCVGCPLLVVYGSKRAMAVRLQHGGKVYGLLTVSIPGDVAVEEQELYLFREVAGDIAFALYNMELEEERRRAVEALRKSEEWYRLLLSSITDGCWVLDKEWRYKLVNEAGARLVNMVPDQLVGHKLTELFPGVEKTEFFAAYDRSMRERTTESVTGPFTFPDGRMGVYEVHVYPAPDGILCIGRDITARKQAEEALRDAEARYHALVEQLPAIIYIVEFGKVNRTIYISPQVEWLLGFSQAEWLADADLWIKQLHPDDRDRVLAEVRRRDARGEPLDLEYRVLTRDGRVLWIRNQTTLVRDETGRIRYSQGIMLDITERKQTEEALRLRMEQLSALGQAAQAVTASLELNQVLTEIVSSASKVVGADYTSVVLVDEAGHMSQSAENLPGVPSLMPSLEHRIRDEGFTSWIVRSHRAVVIDEIGEDGTVSPDPGEGAPRTANPYLVEAGIRSFASLPLIVKGRLLGVLYVHSLRPRAFHDQLPLLSTFANYAAIALENARLYTAVQKELAARKEAEEAYRVLVEHSLQGIAVIQDGRVVFANPALVELCGYSQEELLSFSPEQVKAMVHPDDQEWVWDSLMRRLAGEPIPPRREFRFLRKDGQVRWVEVLASPIEYRGRPAVQAAYLDVTERKEAEEALRRRDAILSAVAFAAEQLLSDVSFDESANAALARLGQAADISRVYVFENHVDEHGTLLTSQRYEWGAAGITPQIDNPELQNFPWIEGGFGRWVEALSKNEVLYGLVRDFPESERSILEPQNIISIAIVPIFVGGEWWGFIGFDDCLTERHWSSTEIEALRAAAGALGAAIQRKRAEEALRRRAEEMAALQATVLDIIAPHDLPTLLQTIVERAARLLHAPAGGIYLCDPDRREARCVVSYNTPRDYTGTVLKYGEGAAGIVAQTGQPLVIDDYRTWSGRAAVYEEEQPFRAVLSAPMIWQGQVTGVIHVLHYEEGRRFTEADLEVLTLFANHAAIAIENARLLEETRQRAAEAAALLETSLALNTLDLDSTLRTIGERAKALFAADGCRVFLLEPDGETLRCVLALHERGEAVLAMRPKLGQGVTGDVARRGEAEIVNDMLGDPRSIQVPGTPVEQEAMMFAPLKERERVIGVMSVSRLGDERPFHPADLELLKAFAAMATSAISNARLFEQTQRWATEMTSLYTISLRLATAGELSELLQTVVRQAAALVQTSGGGLYLYDPAADELELTVVHGIVPEEDLGIRLKPGEGLSGKVMLERRPLVVDDYRTWEGRSPQCEGQPFTAVVGVPLLWQDQLIGVLNVTDDKEQRTFDENDVRLLTLLAQQAAAAIANARSLQAEQKRAEQLAVINELGRSLAATLDLRSICRTAYEHVQQLVDCPYFGISLFDPQQQTITAAFMLEQGQELDLSQFPPLSYDPQARTGRSKAIATGRPEIVSNMLRVTQQSNHEVYHIGKGPETLSALYVPMIVEGQVIGLLEVQSCRKDAYRQEDTELLSPVANHIGLAIQNARLFDETRRLKEFNESIVQTMTEGIIIEDANGICTFVNPAAAEMLDYTPEELIGQHWTAIVPPDQQPIVQAADERRRRGESDRYELELVRKDGRRLMALVSSSPRFEDGRFVGTMAVFTDITERKLAEEERQQSYLRLQRALEGTVQVLISAVEMRDPYTAGHQRRVAQLACAIAKEMGFSQERIEAIRIAGLTHDVGKISVPAEILSKPGKLTDIQWSMIKAHPQISYDILREVEFPWPVAEIVLQHHERMDGSGYPRGLLGKDTLLEARILAVADVVEAMASYRPYRPAHGVDRALEEISQNKGTLYDPEVVDACLRLFAEKGFEFE
jgi:PAS domain S-box-containing protein